MHSPVCVNRSRSGDIPRAFVARRVHKEDRSGNGAGDASALLAPPADAVTVSGRDQRPPPVSMIADTGNFGNKHRNNHIIGSQIKNFEKFAHDGGMP